MRGLAACKWLLLAGQQAGYAARDLVADAAVVAHELPRVCIEPAPELMPSKSARCTQKPGQQADAGRDMSAVTRERQGCTRSRPERLLADGVCDVGCQGCRVLCRACV
jgi:hypothetical protein